MSKVVHILTDTNIGGAGVWLKRTLQYIENDFEVTVLIPEQSLLKDYLKPLAHIHLIEVPYIGDKSFSIKGVFAIHKILKKVDPAIVHTHASLSGRLAAKALKNTWCLNSRHCIEPLDPRPVVRYLKHLVNSHLSDQTVAVSHGVYDNLLASGLSEDQVVLVPNGIDPLEAYTQADIQAIKKSYGILGKKVLGYVGRLEAVKGPEFLLEIMSYIKAAGREDCVLLVAGDGSMKAPLEAATKAKGLKQEIQWLGFVEETEALYNIMDCCLNTSRSEAISLTLLEAMSLGRPVIAFDVDGLDQVIQDGGNGYLVEAFDTEAYAARLLQVLDDSALQTQLGDHGAAFVREQYSMASMIETLKTTYKERHSL